MSTALQTSTVDRLIDAIVTATGIPADLYADGATLDATVPGWRFHKHGPEAIAAEYSRWFAHSGQFEELGRRTVDGGEVVITYTLTWTEDGVPFAAHHCHVLTLTPDRRKIAADTVFGRWDAALLAQMAEADG